MGFQKTMCLRVVITKSWGDKTRMEELKELEKEFYKDIKEIYRRADKECNYRPTKFLQMLSNHGGVGAARILIDSPGGTEGFTRLWELGRLDLSVEALVIKDKYKDLFTRAEIDKCIRVLEEYKYFPS